MADVFLSYATGDRPFAERLATALAQQGWSVWWDRHIPHGKDFNEVIQAELDAAKCIIVLWSAEAVRSKFVRDEATEGVLDGRLVPVVIEQVRQPLGFRQVQAADLSNWRPGASSTDFSRLLESIASALNTPLPVTAAAVRRVRPSLAAIAASAAASLASIAAGVWCFAGPQSSVREPSPTQSPVVAAPTGPPMKVPSGVAQVPPGGDVRGTQAPPPPRGAGTGNQGLPPALDEPSRPSRQGLPEAPPIDESLPFRVRVGEFDAIQGGQVERVLRRQGLPVLTRQFGAGRVAITLEPYRGYSEAMEGSAALSDLGHGGAFLEVIK